MCAAALCLWPWAPLRLLTVDHGVGPPEAAGRVSLRLLTVDHGVGPPEAAGTDGVGWLLIVDDEVGPLGFCLLFCCFFRARFFTLFVPFFLVPGPGKGS